MNSTSDLLSSLSDLISFVPPSRASAGRPPAKEEQLYSTVKRTSDAEAFISLSPAINHNASSPFKYSSPPSPPSAGQFCIGPIGLVRFLKVCQDIEADLRVISVESRRRHPEIKSLAERGLLKVGDFRDRREFVYRTGMRDGSYF